MEVEASAGNRSRRPRRRCAEPRCDSARPRDVAAIVEREAGFFESKAVDSGAAAGEERGVGFEDFTAFHCESHATRRVFGFDGALVQQKMHAEFASDHAGDRKSRCREMGAGDRGRLRGDVDSKALKMEAYFTAMTPPPMTARLFGMRSICKKVSESNV